MLKTLCFALDTSFSSLCLNWFHSVKHNSIAWGHAFVSGCFTIANTLDKRLTNKTFVAIDEFYMQFNESKFLLLISTGKRHSFMRTIMKRAYVVISTPTSAFGFCHKKGIEIHQVLIWLCYEKLLKKVEWQNQISKQETSELFIAKSHTYSFGSQSPW